jgi:hypothetical protein
MRSACGNSEGNASKTRFAAACAYRGDIRITTSLNNHAMTFDKNVDASRALDRRRKFVSARGRIHDRRRAARASSPIVKATLLSIFEMRLNEDVHAGNARTARKSRRSPEIAWRAYCHPSLNGATSFRVRDPRDVRLVRR